MARKTPPFARIALDYADHPKIAGLSDAAFRAHIELILYARRYLTDGRIPTRKVTQLGSDLVTELVSNDPENPSLIRDENGDYWLYGFDYWQESKSEVEARAQVSRVNGSRGGRPKTQPGSRMGSQPGSIQGTQTEPASKAETETETEIEAKASMGPRKRGSRLPDDWTPSNDDREYATKRGVDPDREAEKFRNYWHSKAGKDAAKLDWAATWRNWILKAEQDRPHLGTVTSGPWKPPPGSPLSYVEM